MIDWLNEWSARIGYAVFAVISVVSWAMIARHIFGGGL